MNDIIKGMNKQRLKKYPSLRKRLNSKDESDQETEKRSIIRRKDSQ